jgi:hypothetical protein
MTSLAQENPLAGVIDIHAHCAPDSTPRSIDAIDLARLAKSRGMRGLVLKNHYQPTASLAYVVRKEVPGIEVFGGVDLNLSVGGMNPFAVEHMAATTGGYGRFVWMSTFDSEAQVRYSKQDRPFVRVSQNGQLLPETRQVISVIGKHNLVMATGHVSAEEGLMLIREARIQGVQHMVVTHAMLAPIHMSDAQMLEAAKMGVRRVRLQRPARLLQGVHFQRLCPGHSLRGSRPLHSCKRYGAAGKPLAPGWPGGPVRWAQKRRHYASRDQPHGEGEPGAPAWS